MKNKINYIYLFLLISIIFLLLGTFLTIDAYFGMHAVEIASNEIEFVKNLSFSVDVGQKKKIPLYKENYFLKKHPFIEGYITVTNYENTSSIRQAQITLKRPFFFKTNLFCLIDTRNRN